jgi:hypothetical protein
VLSPKNWNFVKNFKFFRLSYIYKL